MAPIKPYKPNELNVNPFAIAQGIALPYDYDGTLKEMTNWQQLTNQEATTDFNQTKAADAKKDFDLETKRDEMIKGKVDAGEDLDMQEIAKSIGDYDSLIKLGAEAKKQKIDQADRQFKLKKDLSSISAKNPEYAQQLANEMGIGDFRAPAQKGDKPDKPKAPKIELWTNGRGDTVDVDVNDPAAVSAARKNGLISLGNASKAKSLGIDVFAQPEEETPKDTRSWWERINGDKPKIVGATPENPSSQSPNLKGLPKPPPGHLLVKNKKTGKIEIIKK